MTVKSDIEKAIASEQAAVGTYAMFAASTDDPAAKQMFEQMQQDAQRHIQMLNGRLNYLSEHNPMYNQPEGQSPSPQSSQGQSPQGQNAQGQQAGSPNQDDPKIIQTQKQPKSRR
jgi:rubrerythrin